MTSTILTPAEVANMNKMKAIMSGQPEYSAGYVYHTRCLQSAQVAGMDYATARAWMMIVAGENGIEVRAMRDDSTFGYTREQYQSEIVRPRANIIARITRRELKKNPAQSNSVIARIAAEALEKAAFPQGSAGYYNVMCIVRDARKQIQK